MKKFLALFLAIIIAITLVSCLDQKDTPTPAPEASPDGGDASTTTTTTAKDNTPKRISGFYSGGEGAPPVVIVFNSTKEIQEFITAANSTEEEFEKYAEKSKLYYAINQKVAMAVAHNLELIKLPTMPFKITEDNFGATYYLDRNELDVICLGDNLKYSFVYKYNERSIPTTKQPLFKENTHIGDHATNLYEGTGCLVGYFMDDMVLVQAIAYSDDYQAASFEGITFKSLADIK